MSNTKVNFTNKIPHQQVQTTNFNDNLNTSMDGVYTLPSYMSSDPVMRYPY